MNEKNMKEIQLEEISENEMFADYTADCSVVGRIAVQEYVHDSAIMETMLLLRRNGESSLKLKAA